jgi:hypothetical protein
MMAFSVSGAAFWRALRTTAVAAVAVSALGLSNLQVYLAAGPLDPQVPEFYTSANVVVYADERAHAAGISPGDRIDYSLMPTDDRFGSPSDGLRAPPPGKSVSYVIEHNGRRHTVTFAGVTFGGKQHTVTLPTATYDIRSRSAWFSGFKRAFFMMTPREAAILVLILLASVLALIRPSGLTIGLFLLAAPYGAVIPYQYAFLPPRGYAALMVLSDILVGLGAIGLLALALYIDPRRHVRSSKVIASGALLLAVIVGPLAISDVSEIMVGTRPEWPLAGWASLLALLFCYIAAIALLLQLAATTRAPRILRVVAVLLATIAITLLLGPMRIIDNSWYVANLPTVVFSRELWPDRGMPLWLAYPFEFFMPMSIARPFALLVAFYLVIRSKIVDTGPVLTRMVAYVIIASVIIALFALFNIVFTQVNPGYALLAPLEIFLALAIGYRVSGLRDLAGCLSLATVDAWNFWAKGQVRDERDALTHSLHLAERTRQKGLIAEVRAQIAFNSWCNGDEAEFERNADALMRLLGNNTMRGIRGFALAATSDVDELRFEDTDLPEWNARAALLRCARTKDAARAQQYAADALTSAELAGLASLQVLALVAIAESRSEQRDVALERAHAIACDAGWPALSKSILALRANGRNIGILESFVDVRLRKSRPARPMFEVSFFNAELYQNSVPVSLAEKELELLLAVASARAGVNNSDLIDDLWPESDGDAARATLRVCLHRLRKKSGDARIVTRVGKGYVLHPWADVDLWRFQSTIAKCRETGGREGASELRDLCDALRAGEWRRATLGEWFYRFERVLSRKLDEAERLLGDAVARGARA